MAAEVRQTTGGRRRLLSVIVTSVTGYQSLDECLEALEAQSGSLEIEIIVADRLGDDSRKKLASEHPGAKILAASPGASIPEMRAMALKEAAGEVVAVLEDHCVVSRDWASKMMAAHERGCLVVAGPLKNLAGKRLVDWAAFFCEYNQFMYPVPEGESAVVPGNNTSYETGLLRRYVAAAGDGAWEMTLHEMMRGDGVSLYMANELAAGHRLSAPLTRFVSQKYHFARAWAGTRFDGRSRAVSLLYAAASVILPVLLGLRIFASVWKKGSNRTELLLSSPFLALLVFSWTVGEISGYLLGPGDSTARVA